MAQLKNKDNEMELLIDKYKICSYQFGYALAKKKGKSQWSKIGYYDSIENAINDLFDYRVRTETSDFVIDFNNKAQLESQKLELLEKIMNIKEEIMKGLNGGSE